MTEAHDYSALKWLDRELGETIGQARNALQEFVEGSGSKGSMEACANHVHQVQGILQMVQVHGAMQLAGEIELSARRLAEGTIQGDEEEAAETLMMGLIRLPDYLEQVQSDNIDNPLLIKDMLNQLRAMRGEPPFEEYRLLGARFAGRLRSASRTSKPNPQLPKLAKAVRPRLQRGLLGWLRGSDVAGGLDNIRKVMEVLERSAGTDQVTRIFHIVRMALILPLKDPGVSGAAIKKLFAKVDQVIKHVVEGGEGVVVGAMPLELLERLLYEIAIAEVEDDELRALRDEYSLDAIKLCLTALHSGGGIRSTNREMLTSFREALGDDLTSIKDKLDLFIRTGSTDPHQLAFLEPPLRTVAGTLGMVGQDKLRKRLLKHADLLKATAGAGSLPGESDLMSMAGDILFVETSLENLTSAAGDRRTDDPAMVEGPGALELPSGEYEKLVSTVIQQATIDMHKCKDAILAYLKTPDDVSVLQQVPTRFSTISGAFDILKLAQASALVKKLAGFVSQQIIRRRIELDKNRMNIFADSVTSIEYFMETMAEGRGVQKDILSFANQSLDDLIHMVGDEDRSELFREELPPTPEVTLELGDLESLNASKDNNEAIEIVESAGSLEEQRQADEKVLDEVDPEILEIFIEEAREELGAIREFFPRWKNDREDRDALTTFRRSFHTLKGSGRLVGAVTIGELAWSVENLLNRIIDQTVQVSNETLAVIEEVVGSLPALVECLEKGREPKFNVQPMIDKAIRLAEPAEKSGDKNGESKAKAESPPAEALASSASEPEAVATPAPIPTAAVSPSEATPEVSQLEEVDPEILEIFIEEAKEELESIGKYYPVWRENQSDKEAIITFRRSFHTLKGSGRMVGAVTIGELAWSIENLINRIIDDSVKVSAPVLEVIDETISHLPHLIDCQEHGKVPQINIQPLVDRAFEVAKPGGAAQVLAAGVSIHELVMAGGAPAVVGESAAPPEPEPEPEPPQPQAAPQPLLDEEMETAGVELEETGDWSRGEQDLDTQGLNDFLGSLSDGRETGNDGFTLTQDELDQGYELDSGFHEDLSLDGGELEDGLGEDLGVQDLGTTTSLEHELDQYAGMPAGDDGPLSAEDNSEFALNLGELDTTAETASPALEQGPDLTAYEGESETTDLLEPASAEEEDWGSLEFDASAEGYQATEPESQDGGDEFALLGSESGFELEEMELSEDGGTPLYLPEEDDGFQLESLSSDDQESEPALELGSEAAQEIPTEGDGGEAHEDLILPAPADEAASTDTFMTSAEFAHWEAEETSVQESSDELSPEERQILDDELALEAFELQLESGGTALEGLDDAPQQASFLGESDELQGEFTDPFGHQSPEQSPEQTEPAPVAATPPSGNEFADLELAFDLDQPLSADHTAAPTGTDQPEEDGIELDADATTGTGFELDLADQHELQAEPESPVVVSEAVSELESFPEPEPEDEPVPTLDADSAAAEPLLDDSDDFEISEIVEEGGEFDLGKLDDDFQAELSLGEADSEADGDDFINSLTWDDTQGGLDTGLYDATSEAQEDELGLEDDFDAAFASFNKTDDSASDVDEAADELPAETTQLEPSDSTAPADMSAAGDADESLDLGLEFSQLAQDQTHGSQPNFEETSSLSDFADLMLDDTVVGTQHFDVDDGEGEVVEELDDQEGYEEIELTGIQEYSGDQTAPQDPPEPIESALDSDDVTLADGDLSSPLEQTAGEEEEVDWGDFSSLDEEISLESDEAPLAAEAAASPIEQSAGEEEEVDWGDFSSLDEEISLESDEAPLAAEAAASPIEQSAGEEEEVDWGEFSSLDDETSLALGDEPDSDSVSQSESGMFLERTAEGTTLDDMDETFGDFASLSAEEDFSESNQVGLSTYDAPDATRVFVSQGDAPAATDIDFDAMEGEFEAELTGLMESQLSFDDMFAEPSVAPEPAPPAAACAIEIDPTLQEIFTAESRTHLASLRAFLSSCQEAGTGVELDETVTRALHTLRGSAHMAEVSPISDVSGAMECYAKALLARRAAADDEFIELLEQSVGLIEIVLGLINIPGAELPEWKPLMERAKESQANLEATTTDIKPPPVSKPAPQPLEAPTAVHKLPTRDSAPVRVVADEELIEVFIDEAEELLDSLDGTLIQWQTSPAEGDEAIAEMQRSLHTLKGSSRLAGIVAIGDLSHAFESLLVALKQGKLSTQPEVLEFCQRVADRLSRQVEEVRTTRRVTPANVLVALLEAVVDGSLGTDQLARMSLAASDAAESDPAVQAAAVKPRTLHTPTTKRETLPETIIEVDADPELAEIFLEEAKDLLDALDQTVHDWGGDISNLSPVAELQRVLHTLKGSSRLAGIAPVGDLSHAFESLLVAIKQEDIVLTPQLFSLVQSVTDRLVEQIAEVRDTGKVSTAHGMIGLLDAARDGEEIEFDAPPAKTAAPAPSANAPATPVADTRAASDTGQAAKKGGGREQVRVRPELLDRLVNYAGEISIYRARLEEQNSTLGFNLQEMIQTVGRLRSQLRQLDGETEAQILSRYEKEIEESGKKRGKDFDPLEMDQFSTMQQLSRGLVETVSDLLSINEALDSLQRGTDTLLLQQSRVSVDLQDGLMRTRMVPFSQSIPRLRRLIRQTCASQRKRADLTVVGGEAEIDRNILDRVIGPIEHLLRNSVSHGIELPEERLKKGKSDSGMITFTLAREGNDVLIQIADDGAGLNLDRIREKAIKRGLLAEGAKVADEDLMQFILEHGFSTASQIDQVAGRGVGMDVVVSEVKQMGGSLKIQSEWGKGARFILNLPLTLAVTDSLLMKLGEDIYAVPHNGMEGVVRISREDLLACYEGRKEGFEYAGNAYLVRYLGGLLGTSTMQLPEQQKWFPLLLVRAGDHRVGLQVDELMGNREVVVKPLGHQLNGLRWLSGGTILADGQVALILDAPAVVRMDAAKTVVSKAEKAPAQEAKKPEQSKLQVLVVDDSITVRKVTTRFLTRHNMDVVTAKDGVDAVAQLQELRPDIMLLDIEMPRMDGYELARHIKHSEELRHIPLIMITSRTGDKHRNVAKELGVEGYLGKPYQESELLENIHQLTAGRRAKA